MEEIEDKIIEEQPQETQLEEVAPSQEDIFMENISNKYPDLSRDEKFGHANNKYNQLRDNNNTLTDAANHIMSSIGDNDEVVLFVKELQESGDVIKALKFFPQEMLERAVETYEQEDADNEDYNQRMSAVRDGMRRNREFNDTFEQETEAREAMIAEAAERRNTTPEAISEAISEVLAPLGEGRISAEFIELILKGKEFDEKLQQVEQEAFGKGEVSGKNTVIEEKRKKLDKKKEQMLPEDGRSTGATGQNVFQERGSVHGMLHNRNK